MLKTCIIHIGMHKTGSTSIQATLHNKNRVNNNFTYANLENQNHSIRIFGLFHKNPENFYWFKKNGWSKNQIKFFNNATRNMLIDNIKNLQTDSMIISGEAISKCSKYGLELLKDFLSEYFQEIRILAYVRSPKSYMESSLQQHIKDGMKHFSLDGNLDRIYPNYQTMFGKFDEVFGAKNVQLIKFDSEKFKNSSVIFDFYQKLALNTDNLEIKRVNESLSAEAVALLFIYRRFGPGYGFGVNAIKENNKIINILKDIGDTKLKLSPLLIKPILNKNKKDLAWIEKRLNVSLTENTLPYANDILKDEDLLNVSPKIIESLKDKICEDFITQDIRGENPIEIAKLVHLLRLKR